MKHKLTRLLINPFEDCQEIPLLVVGTGNFIISIMVSYRGKVLYDGVIQIHMGATSLSKIIFGNLSNLVILTAGLFVVAKIIYRKVRFIDVLNNVLIARIPLLISGLLVMLMSTLVPLHRLAEEGVDFANSLGPTDMIWIAVLSVFLLFFMVYFFYLLVVGFRHSVNSKKVGHGFLVVIVVFILDGIALFVYRGFFI